MFRKLFLSVVIFFIIINIYSQNNLGELETNEKIIGVIIFENLKSTNPKYLLSKISVKEGYVWNETVKAQVEKELFKISSIVEDIEITAIEKENNIVDIKIKVLEKSAFLVIPYATYSNSNGIMPKIIFRHYNLGGYRKYLNSKLEFLPKESLNLFLLFKDPEANFNENISYEIKTEFRTSLINYFIKGIAPLGVLGDSDTSDRWNDKLFIQGGLGGELTYKVPYSDIEITPKINFNYKRILNKEEAAYLPVDIIKPGLGLDLSFPIKSIRSAIKPSFYLDYKYTLGDEDNSDSLVLHYYRNIYDSFTPQIKFVFSYLIPKIDATLEPYIKLNFELNNSYYYADESLNSLVINDTPDDDYLDLTFGVNFSKSFSYWKIKHGFKIESEFVERLYGNTEVTKVINEDGDENTYSYPYYFKSKLDFTYEFDYNIFKSHHFKMKYLLFTRYNQLKKISKYEMGENPGRLEGFAGLIANFKYELPIFDIETPKFASFSIKRPLRWKVFWDFYLDLGLALTDTIYIDNDDHVFTFNRNYLHIFPAAGLGTSIRFLPKFAPIEIAIDLGVDIYGILKQKSIGGNNIVIGFSVNDKF